MRSTLLLICSLLFSGVVIGAVDKWVDEESNVQYGDTSAKEQE